MRPMRGGIAAAVVVGLLSAACATAPTPDQTSSPSPTADARSPAAPVAVSPGPTAAPIEPPVEWPRPLAWIRVGDVADGLGRVGDLIAVESGYFGWAVENQGYPVAWHSTDGLSWSRYELTIPIVPCSGRQRVPDGVISWGATNGTEAVLVGLEFEPDAAVCEASRAAAWMSPDGRSWTRSEAFGASGIDLVGAHGVWAAPGGWEAAKRKTQPP